MTESLLISILVFMIISSVVALFTDELISAIIAIGALGFGGSIAYLIMGAPDLAITQIVVEVVSLVLLIRVTIGVGLRLTAGCCSKTRTAVAGAVVLLTSFVFAFSLRLFPAFGDAVMGRVQYAPSIFYIEYGLHSTGASNLVTAILLDFRAYDTLGEATVIFTAVLGGIALLRKRGRNISAGDEVSRGDTA